MNNEFLSILIQAIIVGAAFGLGIWYRSKPAKVEVQEEKKP